MANFKFEALTFTYPNGPAPALESVDLSVRDGEFLLVIGPSGGGKSTLLRHFKSVLAPHGERSGSVLMDGVPLSDVPEREQAAKIGFVFQHPDDQLVTDKVWHELAFGLESLGCGRERMRVRVAEMASYFGLEGVFHKDVAELSGGQKQLVNLASVMAMNPSVLVLDEPTSSLDPIAAFDFLTTVKKLNTELGLTVVLSEHRLEEAMPFADRVAVLEEGRLTAIGEPKAVAEELHKRGSGMALAMPSAARISCAIGCSPAALTVNEGRRMLRSMGLTRKTLPETPAPAKGETVLRAKELFFRYEKDSPDVLRGLDIELRAGSVYGLVGGNGAGKSTLLKALSGSAVPYRGRVEISGRRMKGRFSAFEERVGLLPQDPRTVFYPVSVGENVKKAAAGRGAGEEEIERIVSLMGIGSLSERDPFDISGGEQQRTAIAMILLTKPRILLMDEPTKGMDAGVKRAFGLKLRELASEGLSVMLVTHDTEFCAEYADTAALMFDGCISAENTAREFFCGNTFYTTAANRIARDIYPNAILTEEVTALAKRG